MEQNIAFCTMAESLCQLTKLEMCVEDVCEAQQSWKCAIARIHAVKEVPTGLITSLERVTGQLHELIADLSVAA